MKLPLEASCGSALIGAAIALSGCGALPVAAVVGSYAADGALILTTDKSSTDHFVSMQTNRDCGAWRAVTKGGPLCRDLPDGQSNPYNIDYNAPFRAQTDSGLEVVRSGREDGKLLIGDQAREALATHAPDLDAAPRPTTATLGAPGGARFGSAGLPAVASTPEGADVATAGSRSKDRR